MDVLRETVDTATEPGPEGRPRPHDSRTVVTAQTEWSDARPLGADPSGTLTPVPLRRSASL